MRRTLHSIAALPMPRQRYADGGFVQRLKQIVGIDPERNARIAEYRAQAEREKQAASQPPVPPTPQPQSAISGYNGMSAAERRMKEQGLKDGGHVRGPGTGTSDSIPAMLSDGEFVLPADTVRKVGVRRLQDLLDKTHKPVKAKGPNHYVNGDLVEDQTKRPNSFGDAAAVSSNSAVSQVGGSAAASTVPAPPPASVPAPAPAPTPVAAPVSSPAVGNSFGDSAAASKDSLVNQIPTGGLKAPAADGSQDSWRNTETGRNLSNIASALPGALGGAIPAIAKTGGAISGGIDAATRLLNAGAGAAAVSAIPGAVSAQTASAPSSPAGAGRGLTNPPSVNPSSPPPASPERSLVGDRIGDVSSSSNVTRNGNSYSGTNVAGDITINGQAPRAGGQISSQNMTAADNLAGTQGTGERDLLLSAGSGKSPVGMTVEEAQRQGLIGQRIGYDPAYDQRLAGGPSAPNTQVPDARSRLLAAGSDSGPVVPGSFTGGYSGNVGSTSTYGNMRGRSPEQRLRDAEVSASSITNRQQWGGRGAENSLAMQGFRAALQQDSNIRQNQAGADLETLRQTGSLQREGMQQAGETQRTNIRAQRDDAANQIARGRLSLEQIAAGYQNRVSDRLDRAQADLESAKTPEAQRSARERLMALSGKAPQSDWGLQVTPPTKNADGTTTPGSVWRYNRTTGETERVEGGQQMDITKDPRAQAIRTDKKLSERQKQAALARLGY